MNLESSSPSSFDKKELENLVLTSLKRQQNVQDNLIPQIIERTKWDWLKAEKYVNEIQVAHNLSIALWQGKLYTLLSIIFFLSGFGLTVFSIGSFVSLSKFFPCLVITIQNSSPIPFATCIEFYTEGLQSVQSYLTLGICLMLGGIAGILLARRQLTHGSMIVNN